MEMKIILNSGISADGFIIEIEDQFKENYSYGYNASYKETWADDNKPFVSDIIFELMKEYQIEPENVKVINGKNTFKEDKNSANLDDFINNYCKEAFAKYISINNK